jgi:hypothetical protein
MLTRYLLQVRKVDDNDDVDMDIGGDLIRLVAVSVCICLRLCSSTLQRVLLQENFNTSVLTSHIAFNTYDLTSHIDGLHAQAIRR